MTDPPRRGNGDRGRVDLSCIEFLSFRFGDPRIFSRHSVPLQDILLTNLGSRQPSKVEGEIIKIGLSVSVPHNANLAGPPLPG